MERADTKEMRLDVYSHNVKVSGFTRPGKEVLLEYCRSLAQYGLTRVGHGRNSRFVNAMLRVYTAVTADRAEFRFHVHQLNDFLDHLAANGYPKHRLDIHFHLPKPGAAVAFKMNEKFVPKDYQVPVIDYMVSEGHSKVVTLQTGKGKTFCALSATVKLATRTMLVIKGMYVDKWIEDVKDALGLKPGELMTVRGSAHLKALIQLAQAGELEAKFIICTNKTMYNFLQTYEKFNGEMADYGCSPAEFYETCGIGLRIFDEVHQDFHLNYRQDLYTHVPKTISLSATLVSDDPFMNKMYGIMFPQGMRFAGIAYHKYIAATALTYRFFEPNRVRYKSKGRGSYSHVELEEYLMKHKDMLQRYFQMIKHIADVTYIRKAVPGQKLLIFAATVDMCTLLREFLQKQYASYKVSRYVSEDEYENLLSSDITVSTVLSAGTAVDVPGLRIVLMTTALGSRQANDQALGRLRELKDWPDITPEFYYLVCLDIEQHLKYHDMKKENFADKVLSHNTLAMQFKI